MSVYERSAKKSHLHTIWYEISMLRFCHAELEARIATMAEPERYLFIEGFLLHYRNLIEFFSGAHDRGARKRQSSKGKQQKSAKKRVANLSTSHPEIWAKRLLIAEEIRKIQTPARALDDTYWTDISQFLQHCTERRFTDSKRWNLKQMLVSLDPIISAFGGSFPQPQEPPQVGSVATLDGVSTASVTRIGSVLGIPK